MQTRFSSLESKHKDKYIEQNSQQTTKKFGTYKIDLQLKWVYWMDGSKAN